MTTSESKGRFFLLNESIRIYSHNESNLIDSNCEVECSNVCAAYWTKRQFCGGFCVACRSVKEVVATAAVLRVDNVVA